MEVILSEQEDKSAQQRDVVSEISLRLIKDLSTSLSVVGVKLRGFSPEISADTLANPLLG